VSERLPPLRRREAIANVLGCGAILLLSSAVVVAAIVGLVELVRWAL
jgi:hypothetical protein